MESPQGRPHQPLPYVPRFPAPPAPLAQREGGRRGAAGHLLGVVVVVVVDVDGCRDAADDERDAAGDQVEPARGGRRSLHTGTGHGDVGWAAASGQTGADPAQPGGPSRRSGQGQGQRCCCCPARLGQGDIGTVAWAEGPAAPRPRPAAGAPSRSPPCTAPGPSPPSTAAWTGRSSAK